jgi:molybdate transport repressor ModE-like protein
MKPLKVNYRIWVSVDDPDSLPPPPKGSRKKDTSRFIIGLGVARLLESIKTTGSLTVSAETLGYSYKYAWDRTQKLKERLGEPAVEAHKGGRGGGGEMRLTEAGEKVLEMYQAYDLFVNKCLENKEKIEASGLLE